ncbi:glucose-1-phosphate cytidylyltransferase [Chloroflexota bacterium]
MKVIVLAGGKGTRLGQQLEAIPKPMVPIGNKPILWHIMKIYSYQGFNDFIICLGEKANVIKNYFYQYEIMNNDFTIDISSGDIKYHSSHNENNWKVTLVDTGLDTLKGGRIKRVERYLDSDTNMLTYGDGLADIDLNKLLEFHKAHDKIVTITGVHRPSRFGELIEEGGQAKSFMEKPCLAKDLISGGFMVFDKEMLDYLTEDEDCDFEMGPLEQLAQNGQVMVYKHEGNWDCMDHDRDIVYLNELWKANKAFWKIWE